MVRLVPGDRREILDEVLVDASGSYTFNNVESASSSLGGEVRSNRYCLFLYPRGQLSAVPEVREMTYSLVGGQLSPSTAALIASLGGTRNLNNNKGNSFFGAIQDLRGGLGYRWGMTNNLTLGTGLVYDQHLQALGDVFFQPANWDLRLTGNVQVGLEPQTPWSYGIQLDYRPNPSLDLAFDADRTIRQVRANLFGIAKIPRSRRERKLGRSPLCVETQIGSDGKNP